MPGHPRILIVRRRYLGDTVLMEPFVRNLRAHWPAAWIAMVVDTPYVDVLTGVADLSEIVELPVGALGLGKHVRLWIRALRAVAATRWDIVFDFQRNERAQLLVLLARARRRLTITPQNSPLRRRRLYTDVVEADAHAYATSHTVDLHNRLLQLIGVSTPHRVPSLSVTPDERTKAAALLRRRPRSAGGAVTSTPGGRPLLVVHPGSGAQARRWPPDAFARVADEAVRRHRAEVAVLAGPGEGAVAGRVVERMMEPGTIIHAPGSLRTLAAVLAEADLVLCNDSGPMHIAAAVGTPVCALYGAESDVTWGPLGRGRDGTTAHRALRPTFPCGTACVSPDACVPGDFVRMHCIRRIPEADVLAAVDAQLASVVASSRGSADRAPSEPT